MDADVLARDIDLGGGGVGCTDFSFAASIMSRAP